MAMQEQQNVGFAKQLGAQLAQAHAESKDNPIDTGRRQLPAGIRNGVAKLSAMYTKAYEDDKNGPETKGKPFLRASAIVMGEIVNGQLVKEHKGENIEGMVTAQVIPICAMPAKGKRKATTVKENWADFVNLFKLLSNGTIVCQDTDPAKIEAYYLAAIKALTDPAREHDGRGPVLISFSTRGWTPPLSPEELKAGKSLADKEEMVFETWHGLADLNKIDNGQLVHNPAAGVADNTGGGAPDHPEPPAASATTRRATMLTTTQAAAPTDSEPTSSQVQLSLEDEVAQLVEIAMNAPTDADAMSEEEAATVQRLEQLAWDAGWTEDQTDEAPNWEAVGDMALNPPSKVPPTTTAQATVPAPSPGDNGVAVGSRFKFAKRTKDGNKFKNSKGEDIPAQDVTVVTVDPSNRTCTVKTVKDGKDVVDIKTKEPTQVKWEWLEPA